MRDPGLVRVPADGGTRVGRLLRLTALWSFAIAQPVYDLLGQAPALFIYRAFQPGDVLLFALLMSGLLPAFWWLALEGLTASLPRCGDVAEHGSIGLLVALTALPWCGSLSNPWLAVLVAMLIGVLAATAVKVLGIRSFLTVLAVSVPVFAVAFLWQPGIRELWWRGEPLLSSDGSAGGNGSPVVLIVFDGLPTASLMDDRGGIDEARYPAFARLAREGTWHRLSTAVATQTTAAVPAILSGRCPDPTRPPTLTAYPRNLFTLLRASYEVEVVESVTRLCPAETCSRAPSFGQRVPPLLADASLVLAHRLTPETWRRRLPPVDQGWGDFWEPTHQGGAPESNAREEQVRRFRELVAGIQPGQPPTVRFAHIVLPHAPFLYLPSGARYPAGPEPGGSWKSFSDDPWLARHAYQRHLLQLAFVDQLLGELLAALDRAGTYDETAIVVTADHGTSFRPNTPRRNLSRHNRVDITAVPLLVKAPYQPSGGVDDRPIQSVEILSRVLAMLGRPGSAEPESAPALGAADQSTACASIDGQVVVPLTLAELREAADRKTALFGAGSERQFPSVGPQLELLGQAVDSSLCEPRQDIQAELLDPTVYEAVDRGSGFVPAQVVGTVYGLSDRELDLAVAVNGIVRATTRPYALRSGGATFSAVVPEWVLADGPNEIGLFAIEREAGCRLSPVPAAAGGSASLLDAQLGLWTNPRVPESGFQKTTHAEGGTMRLTRGRGRLEVPLDRAELARLRAVRVELGYVGPGVRLRVRLGRRVLFNGRVEAAPWSVTLPVGNWKRESPAVLTLQSNALGADGRRAPIGVVGVWLETGDS